MDKSVSRIGKVYKRITEGKDPKSNEELVKALAAMGFKKGGGFNAMFKKTVKDGSMEVSAVITEGDGLMILVEDDSVELMDDTFYDEGLEFDNYENVAQFTKMLKAQLADAIDFLEDLDEDNFEELDDPKAYIKKLTKNTKLLLK